MTSVKKGAENRRANRYSFRMKAKIHPVDAGPEAGGLPEAIETWTRDVSAKGIFLELDRPVAQGTRMELTLHLPAEVTGKPVMLRCVSRVVRIEQSGDRIGVGAAIESYEFIRPLDLSIQ